MKQIFTDQTLTKEQLYENVFHNCRISGSSLTFKEVKDVIELGTNPNRVTYYDECVIVQDYYEALKKTLELGQNRIKPTVGIIRHIAAITLRGTSDSLFYPEYEPYRSFSPEPKSEVVPEKEKIDLSLHKLVDYINDEINITKNHTLAYRAHFELVAIYPFEKANTRVARLLTNYIEAYSSLYLSVIHHKNRKEYLERLDIQNKNRSFKLFSSFMKSQENIKIERI